jgi:hypothetical protein
VATVPSRIGRGGGGKRQEEDGHDMSCPYERQTNRDDKSRVTGHEARLPPTGELVGGGGGGGGLRNGLWGRGGMRDGFAD